MGKRLVFRLGGDAGFFSEFNFLLYAIIYSRINNYDLEVNWSYANFHSGNGSEYYFRQSLKENRGWYNKHLNNRAYRFTNKRDRWAAALVKRLYGIDFFTQDIFEDLRKLPEEDEAYRQILPGKSNRIFDCCRVLIDQLWVFNTQTQGLIDNRIEKLQLPDEYLGFHIRRGDKDNEAVLYPAQYYINKAIALSNCRTAFVLTDDYRTLEELRVMYPEWIFDTFCEPDERGFIFQDFQNMPDDRRREMHLNLFASIEVMHKAQMNFVTYSSNVGSFIKMRGPDNVIGIDTDTWFKING